MCFVSMCIGRKPWLKRDNDDKFSCLNNIGAEKGEIGVLKICFSDDQVTL